MAEVTVTEDDEPLEEITANELGQAQGAAEVHRDQAENQAERAEQAAAAAVEAVEISGDAAGVAQGAAADAETAAAMTAAGNAEILEALNRQTEVLQSLADGLAADRSTRESTPPVPSPAPKTTTTSTDRPPTGKRRGGWYWGSK